MALVILIGLHLCMACAGPDGSSNSDGENGGNDNGDQDQNNDTGGFRITNVRFAILNVDSNYTSVSESDAEISSGYWFQIDYDGQILEVENMSVTFDIDGQCQWTLDNLTEDNLTGTNGLVIRGLRPSNNDQNYQYPDDILPLGNLRVEVAMGGIGVVSEMTESVMVMGEDGTVNAQYIYSEDMASSPDLPLNSVEMIPKALTSNGVFDSAAQTVTCNFSVEDSRVENGEIWFYTNDGEVVAVSKMFVSEGVRNPILNDGNPIDVTGGENIVTVSADTEEIDYLEGFGFEHISQFAVVLTNDGIISSDSLAILENGSFSYTNKYPIHAMIE